MALVKKTSLLMVRWVKQILPKKKTSYRWYEVDHCGM
jgi:hypothetical protein